MNINNNYEISINLNEYDLEWIEKENYKEKIFSIDGDKKTSMISFDKNSVFSNEDLFYNVEIYVLEGEYSNEFGTFKEGTYLNLINENQKKIYTNSFCKVFKKINYIKPSENIIIDTTKNNWHQGYGNLKVYPLFDNTALVKWPHNEKFIPHKHWGGEEIFVLSGIFFDEHGEFPKGSWIRSPHLSSHTPYVKNETLIFVKTGHM